MATTTSTTYLIMKIKQGEEKGINMTVYSDGSPLDLSNYNISFKVKTNPSEQSRTLIDKTITATSDLNTIGQITTPGSGKFTVHLTKEDTSIPISEYALVISLVTDYYDNIISSDYCNNAKFIVCEQ